MPTLVRQIATFLASGVAASGTHYLAYLGLVAAGLLGPTLATIVGFCCGTCVSYALNSRFTFAAGPSSRSFARFWLVTLGGGAVNTALVTGLVAAGAHYAPAGLVAIAVGAACNFAGHKLWTFRAEAA